MKNSENITTIMVKASSKYPIKIGSGLIENAGSYIKQKISAQKIVIITDDIVDKIYSRKVEQSLSSNGFEVLKYVFENGEERKNLTTYGQMLKFLAKNQVTRTDGIVALGGGVVGDMAGFVASTFLRGIKYVQIPTTLLSQIDSSVGGKTAIDLKEGKNLVGAFYQPSLVLCDTDVLSTLPKSVFDDGMGEAVKYALLSKKVFKLFESEKLELGKLVTLCIDYKRQVVEADEFEKNKRKLLNLGHTPAHAIEKLSKYTISHGKAVRMGIDIILKNSATLNLIKKEEYVRIKEILDGKLRAEENPFTMEQIVKACAQDKKRSANKISLLMVHGVGNVKEHKIDISNLKGYLR
ncbi:MAG: 3-dehydroquinate synthase [Clostridia bacterium]|nr:3-dehydroquinate synthase [Clostridia bacterium]